MTSTRNVGRLAGLFWLLSALTGGFGLFYIRSRIIIPDNAAATAANIVTFNSWYRVAIVSILVGQIFMLFTGLTLFRLFKEFDERLARLILVSAIITVALAVANTFNHFGAIWFLDGAEFLRVFTTEQLNALAFTMIRLANGTGQGLIEIFWTPYYFALGLVVFRSKTLPRIIGILLMIMGVGFAINILQKFLIPSFHPALFTRVAMTGGGLGGLPTMFWLLIKGAKVEASQV
jgi:hypothetical protein